MTNQQIISQRPSGLGLDRLGMGMGLFPDAILDRLFSMPFGQQDNLMRRYRKEDGATVLEYNLAGYTDEEISVNIDTALHELIIKAEHSEEGNKRRFATSVALSPYTSPEDVSVSYQHGVLKVEVAPLEQRKQEALVPLQLKGKKTSENKTIEEGSKETST